MLVCMRAEPWTHGDFVSLAVLVFTVWLCKTERQDWLGQHDRCMIFVVQM
jgi:hypothetical protein